MAEYINLKTWECGDNSALDHGTSLVWNTLLGSESYTFTSFPEFHLLHKHLQNGAFSFTAKKNAQYSSFSKTVES